MKKRRSTIILMKFNLRNPLKHEFIPDHMTEGRTAFRKWLAITTIIAITSSAIAILYTPFIVWSLSHLLTYGFNITFVEGFSSYSKAILSGHVIQIHSDFVYSGSLAGLYSIFWYIGIGLLSILITMIPQLFNPYDSIAMKDGDAKWASEQDLERMEKRNQVGIKGGYLLTLGKWTHGRNRGKFVRMIESLSALLLAPPGTGKTAGIVVPSIVSCDNVSFIINDPKPELYRMTGGYREKVSHVFMLNWSKVDEPEKGIFYPRFNFLSPRLVPKQGPDRDTYLDSIAKILIPEPQKGGDSYFVNKGRAALTGFMHYIVAKIGDHEDYNGVPTEWQGMEPSLPLLTDWIATNQFDRTQKDDDYDDPSSTDKLGEWIRTLCDEVNHNMPNSKFPAPRAFKELSLLVNMADKERSGILGSMDQALLPFKNAAVAQRTSACDFVPDDFRGIVDPETGIMKPVSLYICVNDAEAEAFATISALLYQILVKNLISFEPNEVNTKTNRKLGPYTVCFALDEFARLTKITELLTGPEVSRSKFVSFLIAAQSFSQIIKIYSNEDTNNIITTYGIKIILPQNDPETIEKIKKMVSKTTIQRASKSYQEGVSKQSNPIAWSRQEQIEGVDFLRTQDIAALEPGKAIVLVQNFLHRPMKLDLPFYYKDPVLVKRVNYKDSGPHPTTFLPPFILKKRIEEYAKHQLKLKKKSNETLKQDDDKYSTTPEKIANNY